MGLDQPPWVELGSFSESLWLGTGFCSLEVKSQSTEAEHVGPFPCELGPVAHQGGTVPAWPGESGGAPLSPTPIKMPRAPYHTKPFA